MQYLSCCHISYGVLAAAACVGHKQQVGLNTKAAQHEKPKGNETKRFNTYLAHGSGSQNSGKSNVQLHGDEWMGQAFSRSGIRFCEPDNEGRE